MKEGWGEIYLMKTWVYDPKCSCLRVNFLHFTHKFRRVWGLDLSSSWRLVEMYYHQVLEPCFHFLFLSFCALDRSPGRALPRWKLSRLWESSAKMSDIAG